MMKIQIMIILVLILAIAPVLAHDEDASADVRVRALDAIHEKTVRERMEINDPDMRLKSEVRVKSDDEHIQTREAVTTRAEITPEMRLAANSRAHAVVLDRLHADRREELHTRLEGKLDVEAYETLTHVSPAFLATIDAQNAENVVKRLRIKDASDVRFEKRIVNNEEKIELRKEQQNREMRSQEHKDAFREEREEFRDERDELRECETSEENCEDIRARVHARAKASIVGALDALIEHMESLKVRAKASEDLTNDKVDAIVSHSKSIIDQAEELKIQAQLATDGQAVREVAHKVGDLMREAKSAHVRYDVRLRGEQTLSIAKQAEKFDAQLACAIEQGMDLNVEKYEQHIASARAELDLAAQAYANGDLDLAQQAVANAHIELKQAQPLARELMAQINDQVDLDACEIAVDEDEELIKAQVESQSEIELEANTNNVQSKTEVSA